MVLNKNYKLFKRLAPSLLGNKQINPQVPHCTRLYTLSPSHRNYFIYTVGIFIQKLDKGILDFSETQILKFENSTKLFPSETPLL